MSAGHRRALTDDETTAPEEPGKRHLSRRTLLKTAGHAAWVVPAVQIASMAPAFAASDTLLITAQSGTWRLRKNQPDRMTGNVTVKNNSATATTAALQIMLTFPNLYVGSAGTLAISNVTGGWTAGTVNYLGTGTGRTATVVFTATAQVAHGGTRSLRFRATPSLDIPSASGADTVTGSAVATGFTTAAIWFNPA